MLSFVFYWAKKRMYKAKEAKKIVKKTETKYEPYALIQKPSFQSDGLQSMDGTITTAEEDEDQPA
jgi:hypothetical protein